MAKLRKLTQQECAAIWLYYAEYVAQDLGGIEFYKRLGQYEKNCVDDMIRDIVAYEKPARRKPKPSSVIHYCTLHPDMS